MQLMANKKPLIGFVGQGYVGGSYANNFEKRGFEIVRYSLEKQYRANRDKICHCDVVFVCVPTPTTQQGFDISIVAKGLSLVGKEKIAVIKSTIIPGTSRKLQKEFSRVTLLYSPEFLSADRAQEYVDHPFSNIIGIAQDDERHRAAAKLLGSILPPASFLLICSSEEAELIKYGHNVSGYMQILTFNLLYDVAQKLNCDWNAMQPAIFADPMISNHYSSPVHKGGRGAGGACFVKDIAAFAHFYREIVGMPEGRAMWEAAQKYNLALLMKSRKDLDVLKVVFGETSATDVGLTESD
jgi:nucleotide sugar dehydrogenase